MFVHYELSVGLKCAPSDGQFSPFTQPYTKHRIKCPLQGSIPAHCEYI